MFGKWTGYSVLPIARGTWEEFNSTMRVDRDWRLTIRRAGDDLKVSLTNLETREGTITRDPYGNTVITGLPILRVARLTPHEGVICSWTGELGTMPVAFSVDVDRS